MGCRTEGQRCSRSEAGFSLPEMLLVLGLVGLLAGLLMPAFSGFRQAEERRAAIEAVSQLLDQARLEALARGTQTHLVFRCREGAAEDAITLIAAPQLGESEAERLGRWRSLPAGIGFEDSEASLILPAAGGWEDLPVSIRALLGSEEGEPGRFVLLTFEASGGIARPAEARLRIGLERRRVGEPIGAFVVSRLTGRARWEKEGD